jgi:transcriptional antiterminator NusG
MEETQATEELAGQAGLSREEGGQAVDRRLGSWFVVHTYSGYESRVKSDIEQRRTTLHLEDRIHEVVVPEREEIEVKQNRRVPVRRKAYPGYVLVRCDEDEQVLAAIRSTPGVTGFVGPGGKPTRLSEAEVQSLLAGLTEARAPRTRVPFAVGDSVTVKEGPFKDFSGQVAELDPDQMKVVVRLNILGRETPVELEFSQIERL